MECGRARGCFKTALSFEKAASRNLYGPMIPSAAGLSLLMSQRRPIAGARAWQPDEREGVKGSIRCATRVRFRVERAPGKEAPARSF